MASEAELESKQRKLIRANGSIGIKGCLASRRMNLKQQPPWMGALLGLASSILVVLTGLEPVTSPM